MKRIRTENSRGICSKGSMDLIEKALTQGRKRLSEHESKEVLGAYGIPVTREREVYDLKGLRAALGEIGFPIVIKVSSSDISHKTERGLVYLDIRNEKEGVTAFKKIMKEIGEKNGSVLVQEMISGERELMVGLTRDVQFGPCVVFGLGGIFTEILHDFCVRLAPVERSEAFRMVRDIKAQRILDSFRGMPSADLDKLAQMIVIVGQIGCEEQRIKEIDINPVILSGGKPVAVDALIALW